MKKRKKTRRASNDPVFTCICKTCKEQFTITAGEKAWYEIRNLPLPTHCKTCRKARKLLRAAEKMYNITD